MSKGLFVTTTGTDVGKTYVTALMVKKLQEAGLSPGYYKAALSGALSVEDSDAGYLRSRGIEARGVFLNRYTGGAIQEDNAVMIEALTGLPVLDRIAPGQTRLNMDGSALAALYC